MRKSGFYDQSYITDNQFKFSIKITIRRSTPSYRAVGGCKDWGGEKLDSDKGLN